MFNMEKIFEDAEQGVLEAIKLLGDLYLDGYEENDIDPDLSKAIEYYNKAAEAGMEDAFEKNLKFISNDTLDVDFVKYVFGDTTDLRQYTMGTCQFESGRIITADPLCYLQNADNVLVKAKHIKAGSYPIQVSVMNSDMVGLRIVGARMKISDQEAVFYELANCEKENQEVTFAGFPVECGMACFCDEQSAQSYWRFLAQWYNEHEDGNIYDDYFAALFAESYQKNPDYQREDGDLLVWSNPLDGSQIPMFATGLGDGYYTDHWGIDASGEICELVIIFMNPELFLI